MPTRQLPRAPRLVRPAPIDDITGIVIDAAYAVHRRRGPGMLESAYQAFLAQELRGRCVHAEEQLSVALHDDGIQLDKAFTVDLLVERAIVVEIKSTERLLPVHHAQLLTYLRTLDLRVGLLLNFGAGRLSQGVKRIVNDFTDARRVENPPDDAATP